MDKSNILIDNWTLQEVREIVEEGITNRKTALFDFSGTPNQVVPLAAIQIDSLFNLLIDIVLRDELIVDNSWEYVWKNKSKPLDYLNFIGIIRSLPVERTQNFYAHRDIITENLNLPLEVLHKIKENTEYYERYKKSKYPAIGMIVSGTSGYLARGKLLSLSYSPHPLRNYFLDHSPFSGDMNAVDIHMQFIKNEKLNILQRISEENNFTVGKIILSPLIVEIIESSKSIPNMFTVALQLRSYYKNFRNHLNKFQKALDSGDLKKIEKMKRMLDEISIKNFKSSKYGETEIVVGYGLIKLKVKNKFNFIENIKDRFGIRSTLKKLIFTNTNDGTIGKLFKFYDEKDLKLQEEIKNYFRDKNNK